MHFLCRQQHRTKISSPYHLRKVRNEAIQLYFTNESKISHQNLYFSSTHYNERCIKISAAGVDQKLNYNCLKFSEPFTEHQQCLVKGSEYFETLYFAFCWTPSIQRLYNKILVRISTYLPLTLYLVHLYCKDQQYNHSRVLHTKFSCFNIFSHLKKGANKC